MTQREKEIFKIIQESPLIEQNEIAQRLNITRSSVAVHIANLQKKGYVLGRGYLVKEEDYVVGVGAANVDVHGRSKQSIVLHDSNPGNMHISSGGVTRNVCENFARMGGNVKLVTAIGDDVYAEKIKAECALAGIDISQSLVVDNHMSSTYISILDEGGDMYVAMSDMSVLQKMNMEFLKTKAGLLKQAKIITCDSGLPAEVLEGILNTYGDTVPVFIDPVSGAYAKRLLPYVGKVHTLKPNLLETEILAEMEIHTEEDLRTAAKILIEKGVRRVFVSLGKEGVFYMDHTGTEMKRKLQPLDEMANASGGGDAFMAGVVYSTMQGFDVEETLYFALGAGFAAVSDFRTINPNIGVDLIEQIIEERK